MHFQKAEDHVVLTNLQEGVYMFQLTVTDTAEQQDSTNITVTVLNAEQTVGESFQNAPFKLQWRQKATPGDLCFALLHGDNEEEC